MIKVTVLEKTGINYACFFHFCQLSYREITNSDNAEQYLVKWNCISYNE